MASEPGEDTGPDGEREPGTETGPGAGTGTDAATATDAGADPDAVTDDEQTWAVLTHVAAFAGLFVPFGNVLGPLVVWLVKKDESRFVDENGRQSLNFQLTWTVIMFVALVTILVGVGLLLVPLVALAWLVLVVVGAVRASEREVYDYPLTIDVLD